MSNKCKPCPSFSQHHHPMNPYTPTSHRSFIVDLGVWTSCRCFWTSSSHGVPPDCKRLIWHSQHQRRVWFCWGGFNAWINYAKMVVMVAMVNFKSLASDFFTHLPSSARTPPHEFHFEGVFEGLKRMKHHRFWKSIPTFGCQKLIAINPWFSLLRSMSIALAWAPSISCMRPELIGPKYQPKNDELISRHLWKRSGATNIVTVLYWL